MKTRLPLQNNGPFCSVAYPRSRAQRAVQRQGATTTQPCGATKKTQANQKILRLNSIRFRDSKEVIHPRLRETGFAHANRVLLQRSVVEKLL